MNLLKSISVLSASIFIIATSLADDNTATIYSPRDYTVIPPSPEVGTLLKYSEIPIEHFSGLPDVSFELYRLIVGNINVPITLSYHGGGIRNTDKEGNAGLGWNILSEANISRVVYGAPDELYGGDFNINGLLNLNREEREFRKKLINKASDYDPTNGSHYANKLSWIATLGERYMRGLTDMANDVFHIAGLGLSGTFIYNDDGRIELSTGHPITIKPSFCSTNYPQEFIVSDNYGTEYTFSENEHTLYKYPIGLGGDEILHETVKYTSAWHINKITDTTGNEIKFEYETMPEYEWEYYATEAESYVNNTEYQDFAPKHSTSAGTIVYSPHRIKRILGGGISLSFEYDYIDLDHYRKTLVKSITVSTENSNEPSKIYEFIYAKIPCQFRNNSNNFFTDYYETLSEVKENGKPLYRFDYNELGDNMTKNYASCDFGGYYNGANNSSLIPTFNKIYGKGADRSVNPNASATGTLKKIYYPTGGAASIEWESNSIRYLCGTQIANPVNHPSTVKTQTDTLRMCIDKRFKKLKISDYIVHDGHNVELDLTKYFLMNPDVLMTTEYEYSHAYLAEDYNDTYIPNYPHITIRNSDTHELVEVYFLDKETIEQEHHNVPIKLRLPSGRYDFELLFPLDIDGVSDRFKNYFLSENSDAGRIYIYKSILSGGDLTSSKNDYWCGVRVKHIISDSGDGDEPIIKDYFYGDIDPNLSGGVVQRLPEYNNSYYLVCPSHNVPGYENLMITTISAKAFPTTLNGTIGNVQYPCVTTRLSRKDRYEPDQYLNYLSETFRYTSSMDYGNTDYNNTDFKGCQPIGAQTYTSVAHRRGLLTYKEAYGGTSPSKKTAYTYNIYEPDSLKTFTTDAFVICDWTNGGGENGRYGGYDYSIGKYSLIPYNKTIASETTSEKDGYTTTKVYSYFYEKYTNCIDYKLVKCESTINSEGETIDTYYTYFNCGKWFTPLVETEVKVCGETVIEAKRNEYDPKTRLLIAKYTLSDTPVSAKMLLSSDQATTEQQKALISKLEYEYRYNSKGNLIEVSYNGKVLSSFLWGYYGKYPILEASGVGIDDLIRFVSGIGFDQNMIVSGNIYSSESIKILTDHIRTEFPKSEITSLTYHWLIGIMDATDGRGIKKSYKYDIHSRLTDVLDMNNALLRKYEYNSVWEEVEL